MGLKHELFIKCVAFIENREAIVQNVFKEINISLLSETKSSAGDKHETGRAMLQIEREKAGHQLAEIQKVKDTLSKIDIEKSLDTIGLGSIVFTTQNNYFIAISAGKLNVENNEFYAISSNTPIGQLLLGKIIGDDVAFRNQRMKITDIL